MKKRRLEVKYAMVRKSPVISSNPMYGRNKNAGSKQDRDTTRYAITLFLITALVSGALAWVNILTKDIIAEREEEARLLALQDTMPGTEEFERIDGAVVEAYGVKGIYTAASHGVIFGYCVELAADGYGDEIDMIAGVGIDGIITGISIVSQGETPGLGGNISKDYFKEQFKGKLAVDLVKSDANAYQVNAISGATISSRAVSAAVTRAKEIVAEINGGFVERDTFEEGAETEEGDTDADTEDDDVQTGDDDE